MSAMGMSQSDAGFVNDAVIGATGARPAALPISGFDLSINAKEVFDGKETSEKVVIICLDNSIELFASHLLSNFFCEVLFLLLKAFTCLETNELLDFDVSTVLFSNLSYVLSNCLLAIFCFYVNLIK